MFDMETISHTPDQAYTFALVPSIQETSKRKSVYCWLLMTTHDAFKPWELLSMPKLLGKIHMGPNSCPRPATPAAPPSYQISIA